MSADKDGTVEDRNTVTTVSRGHGPLERVTVNLTPRTSRALNDAVALTGDTKTDTINRAVQIYAYLEGVIQAGGEILVRPKPGAPEQLVKFF